MPSARTALGVLAALCALAAPASRFIRDDPRHAAEIFLVREPYKTLDLTAVTAIIDDIKDDFGSAVYRLEAFGDFMGWHGARKAQPRSWKEIVARALANSPST
jgi:hypothetical protein